MYLDLKNYFDKRNNDKMLIINQNKKLSILYIKNNKLKLKSLEKMLTKYDYNYIDIN